MKHYTKFSLLLRFIPLDELLEDQKDTEKEVQNESD